MKIHVKNNILISIFILGLSSIVTQAVVLRETISTFYGNEIFISIILGSWLIWVAVGSKVLGKIVNKAKNTKAMLINIHILIGICFFIEIFLIRYIKTLSGFPGEIPNLIYSFISAALIPAPLCLILGLWWTTAVQTLVSLHKKAEVNIINKSYLLEILGFILGGILFSFALIQVQEFITASILILLNLSAAVILAFERKKYTLVKSISVFLFLIFTFLIFSPYLDKINYKSHAFRFRTQNLLESVNSVYGNLSVTEINKQYNFYENGLLLGSDKEIEFSEDLAHLSLLQHENPKKVLLIGNGFSGVLNEILKHSIDQIYYLELDPKLIKIVEQYIPSDLQQVLHNPKVKIINLDAYRFLKNTNTKFDLIIINLPDPSTTLINRYYALEFFKAAKEKLNKNGILTTYLTFSYSTPGKNLEDLNACIYKTLKKVFVDVIILPQGLNLFFASNNENLTQNPEILVQRFEKRQIKTKFLNKKYLYYRFSNDRAEYNLALFEKNEQVNENTHFKPAAYFYQSLFLIDHFYIKFSNIFKSIALSFWKIFIPVLILCILLLSLKKKKNIYKLLPNLSVAAAGISLMTLELIIIFAYQIAVGYIYFRIALLICAVTAGMAMGVWYGNQIVKKKERLAKSIIKLHLFLIIFCAGIWFILRLTLMIQNEWIIQIIFLFMSVAAGFLGSTIFPVSNKIYISFQKDQNKKTSTIYSSDLIGAGFGSLLAGLILIPVFGVFQTLIFLIIINFCIIYFFAVNRYK